MRVYAVVGGIAAGKSAVARRLARRFGGRVLDADRIGHRVLRMEPVRRRLRARFGADIFGRGGAVDRRRLGARVFGRPARLRALGAIVHPEIARILRRRLDALEQRGVPFVLLDAALFFEFDLERDVDAVLAVTAPRRVRRERLRRRGGLTAAEAEARLASQPGLASWVRRADIRLDTDCSWGELDARLESVWKRLRRVRRGRRGG